MSRQIMDSSTLLAEREADRRRWMSILARCERDRLEQAWNALAERPQYDFLRRPECGLVMVRGRAGGDGDPFNMGEASVTRCSVRLSPGGGVGVAYVMGREMRKAELAAVFDALLQDDGRRQEIERHLIAPAAAAQEKARHLDRQKVAATKVDFFTMVRGED